MREILFRGKHLVTNKWVYGNYQHTDCYKECNDYIGQNKLEHMIHPETLGQYTGLTDKNGTKIFEGDIVKTDKFSEPNKKYIIKYDLQFGAFICQDKYNCYFATFDGDSDQFEIIGNVYDDPEFLRGENNE